MRRGKLETRKAARLVPLLLNWFAANARDLPWRRTLDPYAIWVSEIMLQQTQVKTVIPYYERWMRELPTIETLANASSHKIHKLWEGLGYYTRVRNMQRAAHTIAVEHGGQFPTSFEDVLALPGIGRYTAGAVCSIAFNAPTPILDGNVIRVLTRVFGIRANVREKNANAALWALADTLVTAASRSSRSLAKISSALSGPCSALNQALMELGAVVCTPRAPRCEVCPLRRQCVARRENCAEQLPNAGKRVAATARRFIAVLVERNGEVLIRQRGEGVVNAHLWEFPNVEVPLGAASQQVQSAVEKELGCRAGTLTALGTIRHTITRYRIALEIFRVELNGESPRPGCGIWKSAPAIEALPLTSAHGRMARKWMASGSSSSS